LPDPPHDRNNRSSRTLKETNEGTLLSLGDLSPRRRGAPLAPSQEARQRSEDEFDEWYARYPKKVGKGAARKAFIVARKKVSQTELIAGSVRYAAERQDQDMQFTKAPASWLNGEHWADEPASPRRAATTGGRPQRISGGQFLAQAFVLDGDNE
jgi:hypothetical protein